MRLQAVVFCAVVTLLTFAWMARAWHAPQRDISDGWSLTGGGPLLAIPVCVIIVIATCGLVWSVVAVAAGVTLGLAKSESGAAQASWIAVGAALALAPFMAWVVTLLAG